MSRSRKRLQRKMNMPVDRVREILKISQEPVSLETPIGEEEDSHLGDFIQDDNVPVPAEAAAFYTAERTAGRGTWYTDGKRTEGTPSSVWIG